MEKRPLDVCVISDVHLGTFGCHAKELNEYLKTIDPKILVLNGDIVDIWNFRKSYFPKSQIKVQTIYMNSGDWVENLSTLEYANGKWTLYSHPSTQPDDDDQDENDDFSLSQEAILTHIVHNRPKSA